MFLEQIGDHDGIDAVIIRAVDMEVGPQAALAGAETALEIDRSAVPKTLQVQRDDLDVALVAPRKAGAVPLHDGG